MISTRHEQIIERVENESNRRDCSPRTVAEKVVLAIGGRYVMHTGENKTNWDLSWVTNLWLCGFGIAQKLAVWAYLKVEFRCPFLTGMLYSMWVRGEG